MNDHIRVIDGPRWRTPLTDYPSTTVGNARLVKKNYRGFYHMEGVGGYEFYQARGWLSVTALQQRTGRSWKTWMVDDPLHWDGMREAVDDLPSGKILIAGLGLGLMLHHMYIEKRFTKITVVEMNRDVMRLIGPTLPNDPRMTIVNCDFYRYIQACAPYDGILWDLAVGQRHETINDLAYGHAMCLAYQSTAQLVQFGIRRRSHENLLRHL